MGVQVNIKTRRIYRIDAKLQRKEGKLLVKRLFVDGVSEKQEKLGEGDFDWLVEVRYKPGVTDAVGISAKEATSEALRRDLGPEESVMTATQYLFKGGNLDRAEMHDIARQLLANELVEEIFVAAKGERIPSPHRIAGIDNPVVEACSLDVSPDNLVKISSARHLSLTLQEMQMPQEYIRREGVVAERREIGMDADFHRSLTDVELEMVAQTWSEHCKHKMFNAKVRYYDEQGDLGTVFDSLFNTCIRQPSLHIAKSYNWLVSLFTDNAGIFRFNERVNVAIKVETHNFPSALEGFGGAITGILGVIRDILGAGLSATPLLNMYHFFFGDPRYKGPLPDGVRHPKRARDTINRGVRAGGNESGIPLAHGGEFYDPRFMFRPLVYCGTIGVMPPLIAGRPSHEKKANVGDLVVMIGGRIGKDGIHGATASSVGIDKSAPVQAVQIGNSIMQKKMSDFIEEATRLGLFTSITDNGAGGLSSSVGEMARETNGCIIDLKRAPLKYNGLKPWEILVSESQERMTLAVSPERIGEFRELAARRGVEATVLGEFNDSGKFHIKYGDRTVGYLDMEFLHSGLPQMELVGRWKLPDWREPEFSAPGNMNLALRGMLARLNVCSKEVKGRQYDHEVKGISVVKPYVGAKRDVPSDATVHFVEYGQKEGLTLSQAANPHLSAIDTYEMGLAAFDEALRKHLAVGGHLPDESHPLVAVDNFCWNYSSADTQEQREFKTAQLARANVAIRDATYATGIPFVSGKDSMSNSWTMTNEEWQKFLGSMEPAQAEKMKRDLWWEVGKDGKIVISNPPTLLITMAGKIDDVSKAVTMDAKLPGDLVYVVGMTTDEMGASEYYSFMGEQIDSKERFIGNKAPKTDFSAFNATYHAIESATGQGLAASIHAPTIGGLGVALAQTAFAGGWGMDVDLSKLAYAGEQRDDFALFSQSNGRFVVTVDPKNKEAFEKAMQGTAFAHVGVVTNKETFKVKGLGGEEIINIPLENARGVWKETLRSV